jgi:hypothetical protein
MPAAPLKTEDVIVQKPVVSETEFVLFLNLLAFFQGSSAMS